MTTTREDQRPDWLRRKHAGLSPVDREVRQIAADILLAALEDGQRAGHAGSVPQRYGDGQEPPFDSNTTPDGDARQHNNFLNEAARRIGLSYSGRLTDPATGKCEFCETGWREDKLRCPPSPAGGVDIHWRCWDRSHGRAHVVDHYGPNPDDWHYPPGGNGSRKRQAEPAAADPGPGHRFGADQCPAEPDLPPAGPSLRGAPARKTGTTAPRGPGSAKPAQREAAESRILPDGLRRFLGR